MYCARSETENGHMAAIAVIEAEEPRHAWYLIHKLLIVARLPALLLFWRKGGYLIEDKEGNLYQPIKPS
jgi:hypothetical protein